MNGNMRRLAGAVLAAVVVTGCAGGEGVTRLTLFGFPEGRYEGEFRGGVPHGRGVLVWPDGSRYEGGFRGGVPHGRGVMSIVGGSRIEGEFRDGEPYNGEGVRQDSDGERYSFEFREGEAYGPLDVPIVVDPALRQHAGAREVLEAMASERRKAFSLVPLQEWLDLPPEVRAEVQADRAIRVAYEGDTREGLAHGIGVMTVTAAFLGEPAGFRYAGEFREGLAHGLGALELPNGTRIEGEWRDGRLVTD